jgi:hypothetical protein
MFSFLVENNNNNKKNIIPLLPSRVIGIPWDAKVPKYPTTQKVRVISSIEKLVWVSPSCLYLQTQPRWMRQGPSGLERDQSPLQTFLDQLALDLAEQVWRMLSCTQDHFWRRKHDHGQQFFWKPQ